MINSYLSSLKKIQPANTSLVEFPYQIDLSNYMNWTKYYVGNLNFRKLLLSFLFNKKVMLVFSNQQKMNIAKNILGDIGIKNVGFAKEEQTINPEKFKKFQEKGRFEQFELYFLLKYASHLHLGYGVLDLNSKGDYMVYNLIKDERQVIEYPVVLTTQHGLYAILENVNNPYKDYDIVFFDVEWWYKNYNLYQSRNCDLYYIQNFLDMMKYKYEMQDIDALIRFDNFWMMFMATIWGECRKLFLGRVDDELQINPIVGNMDFYQTNKMLSRIGEFEAGLKEVLSEADFNTLWKQIEHFLEISENIAKLTRKVYGQGAETGYYFLFSEDTKFTNWDEFKEIFQQDKKIIFLSNQEKGYKKLIDGIEDGEEGKIELMRIGTISQVEGGLVGNSIFIVSTIKEESRKLFEAVQEMAGAEGYDLLVENITGGAGKNIYKAQKSPRHIMIGGYAFLMNCYANKMKFEQILVWNVRGTQSAGILQDMKWYQP